MRLLFASACSLALATTACVAPDNDRDESSDTESLDEAPRTTVTLTARSIEQGVTVTNPDGSTTFCAAGCVLSFPAGSVVHVTPTPASSRVDCVAFNHWTGACANQGVSCTLTLTATTGTFANFSHINGCTPL